VLTILVIEFVCLSMMVLMRLGGWVVVVVVVVELEVQYGLEDSRLLVEGFGFEDNKLLGGKPVAHCKRFEEKGAHHKTDIRVELDGNIVAVLVGDNRGGLHHIHMSSLDIDSFVRFHPLF